MDLPISVTFYTQSISSSTKVRETLYFANLFRIKFKVTLNIGVTEVFALCCPVLPSIALCRIKSDSFRNPPYSLYLLYFIIPHRLLKKGSTSLHTIIHFAGSSHCKHISVHAYLMHIYWLTCHSHSSSKKHTTFFLSSNPNLAPL